MDLQLNRASQQEREVISRLLEFNSYEFSRIDGRSIGRDGLYRYRYLDTYWSESGRVPYLFRTDGELAGLTLVSQVDTLTQISEFLVLPKFRRVGIGMRVAQQVFAAHPGPWRIRQMAGNYNATSFWRRAIPVPYIESIDEFGTTVQSFNV